MTSARIAYDNHRIGSEARGGLERAFKTFGRARVEDLRRCFATEGTVVFHNNQRQKNHKILRNVQGIVSFTQQTWKRMETHCRAEPWKGRNWQNGYSSSNYRCGMLRRRSAANGR